jgi:nucleoside-diphosphate-sugar epimerase
MGRYLIAGAGGYVGSRLAEYLLAQGHYVRGLVRDADADVVQWLASRGMAVWQGDITQPESLIGVANAIERVFNLTARSVLENGSVRRVFVEGNRNLIAACSRARSVRAYLFTSNVAAFGDRGNEWLDEDAPIAPCYPLGEVMAEAEQTIMELVRVHNFPAIISRVGSIYGPGRDFVDSVASGTATMIGDGRNYLSHIHVDDLIFLLEQLALHGQPGALYHLADDEPARAQEFYGEIRQRLGMVPPRAFSKERALLSGMDPSVVGMASSSVRLSNQRVKQELNLTLRYPRFQAWLDERIGDQALAESELVVSSA